MYPRFIETQSRNETWKKNHNKLQIVDWNNRRRARHLALDNTMLNESVGVLLRLTGRKFVKKFSIL